MLDQALNFVLRGGLPAFALSAIALLLAARARGPAAAPRRARAVAAGLALGYLVGQGLRFGWPALSELASWPPRLAREGRLRMFWLVGATLLLGLAEAGGRARAATLAGRVALALAVPAWFLLNVLERSEAGAIAARVGGCGAALLAAWIALDRLAARRAGPTVPIAIWMSASAASVGLIIASNAVVAELAGCLAAAVAPPLLLSLRRDDLLLARGAAGVAVVVLACLLMQGVLLTSPGMPILAGLLLLFAPAAAWIGALGPLARLNGAKRIAVELAAVALCCAAALALGWAAKPPPYEYY